LGYILVADGTGLKSSTVA